MLSAIRRDAMGAFCTDDYSGPRERSTPSILGARSRVLLLVRVMNVVGLRLLGCADA